MRGIDVVATARLRYARHQAPFFSRAAYKRRRAEHRRHKPARLCSFRFRFFDRIWRHHRELDRTRSHLSFLPRLERKGQLRGPQTRFLWDPHRAVEEAASTALLQDYFQLDWFASRILGRELEFSYRVGVCRNIFGVLDDRAPGIVVRRIGRADQDRKIK